MPVIKHIQQQPEPVRRQIFAVVMVLAGALIGSFGLATVRGHISGVTAPQVEPTNTPFIVMGDLVKGGGLTASALMSDAGAQWAGVASQLQSWKGK